MARITRTFAVLGGAIAATLVALGFVLTSALSPGADARAQPSPRLDAATGADATPSATPIQHLVVLFQENVPFDHYFGTYPHAANPPGEPRFEPAPGTPTVNGYTQALLTANPNLANPQRLDRTDGNICGSNHSYEAEQQAFDHGLMDQFVQATGLHAPGCDGTHGMDYYDGNTVTALWNYAQRFSLNDNSFGCGYFRTSCQESWRYSRCWSCLMWCSQ